MSSKEDQSDDRAPLWTFDDHLREGSRALLAIGQLAGASAPQPVCHHFSEIDPIDVVTPSMTETYSRLEPLFAAAQVSFVSDRLEAWETIIPNSSWLSRRIPEMHRIAAANSLIYEGWTWEPRGGQPISASTFSVVNNRQASP